MVGGEGGARGGRGVNKSSGAIYPPRGNGKRVERDDRSAGRSGRRFESMVPPAVASAAVAAPLGPCTRHRKFIDLPPSSLSLDGDFSPSDYR